MELPGGLQGAAEQAAQGVGLAELGRAAEVLSGRYRQEVQDGAWHVSGDLAARAYVVTRLPATFAAVSAAMQEVVARRPDFAPATLLDVGSGPGTALWAAAETWPTLRQAALLEGSPHMREWGQRLGRGLALRQEWHAADVRMGLLKTGLPGTGTFELVTLAYVLNELTVPQRQQLISELWACTAGTLLIVEPGTTAGWQRILEARSQLLTAGAALLAPCPHAEACPVALPDWCHFSQRVARSSLHRRGKGAELGYEDEKFIYLAASRLPDESENGEAVLGRVLTPPATRSGLVQLKLCTAGGTLEHRTYSKRDGAAYRQARKLEWGDALEAADG